MALTDSETQMVLSLRDEATAQWGAYAASVKSGAGDIKSSINDANDALKVHGAVINDVTNFYQAQRGVQREQSFYFRESKDLINAASFAFLGFMGSQEDTSESTQKLNKAMMEGFAAFQGIDFLMVGLGAGPMGIVAAGLAGIAVVLTELTSKAKSSAEAIKLVQGIADDYNKGIGLIEASKELGVYNAVIARNQDYVTTLQNDNKELLKSYASLTDQTKILATQQQLLNNQSDIDHTKGVIAAQILFRDALQKTVDVDKQLDVERQRESAAKEQQRLAALLASYSTINEINLSIVRNVPTTMDAMKPLLIYPEAIKLATHEAQEDWQTTLKQIEIDNKIYEESWNAVSGSLKEGFAAAFAGTADASGVFLKAIINHFIDLAEAILLTADAAAAGKSIFTFGTSLIADYAEIAAGYAVLEGARAIANHIFHQGGSFMVGGSGYEVPVGFMAQPGERVTVQTPAQQQQSSGATIVVNINAPGTAEDMVKQALQEGLRQTGLSLDQYIVNKRASRVSIS